MVAEVAGAGVKTDYLGQILDRKREEIEALRARGVELERAAEEAPPPRGWRAALDLPGRVALIAEVKRKAPSSGVLDLSLDPAAVAGMYQGAGAAALSVLTDLDFQGSLDDLASARAAIRLPVLRKDFVLDALQLFEARAAGADAILLIVAALDDSQLHSFLDITHDLGMGSLVEVHDEEELERALSAEAPVIGINNRDLTTFRTSLDVTRRLAPKVPGDRILVAESGIQRPEQVEELGELGVEAILVGTALVRHEDPAALARQLTGWPRRKRR